VTSDQLEALLAVVDRGGFTAAAEFLGVSKQAVSRRVAELERELAVALFTRSSRHVKCTIEGETFVKHARVALRELADGVTQVKNQHRDPTGEIWIGAPGLFAKKILAPVVRELLEQHSKLRIGVRALGAADMLDFDELDIIVAVGALPDLSVQRLHLGEALNGCFAAPRYLERAGLPLEPRDLLEHDCLSYTRHRDVGVWNLSRNDGTPDEVPIRSRLKSNDAEYILEAAAAGMGIAHLPVFLCSKAVSEGRLRRVLPDWKLRIGPIRALYQKSSLPTPGVEVVLNSLRNHPALREI